MSMQVWLLKESDREVLATSSTKSDSSLILDIETLPLNTNLILRYEFFEK